MRAILRHTLAASIAIIPCALLSQQPPGALQPNILYGAAYYNEYMPADLSPAASKKTSPS